MSYCMGTLLFRIVFSLFSVWYSVLGTETLLVLLIFDWKFTFGTHFTVDNLGCQSVEPLRHRHQREVCGLDRKDSSFPSSLPLGKSFVLGLLITRVWTAPGQVDHVTRVDFTCPAPLRPGPTPAVIPEWHRSPLSRSKIESSIRAVWLQEVF